MKWRYIIAVIGVAATATVLQAHDFFFRTDTYFVQPNGTIKLRALNGTFSKSENSITRDRLGDLSLVGPTGRQSPDTANWSTSGDTSVLTAKVGAAGTYIVGASLKPRQITLKAPEFNKYLADDGIPDVLTMRRKNGQLNKDATERYSKHIKALIQVGTKRDGAFATILGYPAELVPLDNPYSSKVGGTVRFRALVDGKPAANQLVVTGGRTPTGGRLSERRVRTDASGIARVRLSARGQWYVKFIHMTPFSGTERIDYESKWATLTFEVR
ncbi:MAG: DUF4198 domain-containing protein [Gemmatimonadales bacterium]